MKEKIREDAFRTFKGNQSFWTRVDDSCDTMIRILDAVSYDCGYVQGMNVLLAPFLYLMPELDSYYCYRSLISDHCPTYIEKNVEGAKLGCSLFIECFSILDKELYDHIQNVSQHYKSDILSVLPLPYVFTLLANKKPLEEALRIWDSIFAFGVHLNIIVMVVYFMLVRNDLLKEKSAYK